MIDSDVEMPIYCVYFVETPIYRVLRRFTERGTRTLTMSPSPDFESGASTNSAISAKDVKRAQYSHVVFEDQ